MSGQLPLQSRYHVVPSAWEVQQHACTSSSAFLGKQYRDLRMHASWKGEAHNGRSGEEQREHGGHELVEADARGARQQRPAAAQVHCAHLTRKQTDAHHPQRPACTRKSLLCAVMAVKKPRQA